jgi:hypothetical protein
VALAGAVVARKLLVSRWLSETVEDGVVGLGSEAGGVEGSLSVPVELAAAARGSWGGACWGGRDVAGTADSIAGPREAVRSVPPDRQIATARSTLSGAATIASLARVRRGRAGAGAGCGAGACGSAATDEYSRVVSSPSPSLPTVLSA